MGEPLGHSKPLGGSLPLKPPGQHPSWGSQPHVGWRSREGLQAAPRTLFTGGGDRRPALLSRREAGRAQAAKPVERDQRQPASPYLDQAEGVQ